MREISPPATEPPVAPMTLVSRWGALVLWLGLCWGVAALGGVFTASSVSDWYVALHRPSWNPPSWVFGPAWTVLYVLMAVAAWRVWTRRDRARGRLALGLFLVQLLLNLGWSIVFFGLRQPGWAVLEIAALWLAIAATLVAFWQVDRPAAILLMPYLAWVSFAAALNTAIWRLNG